MKYLLYILCLFVISCNDNDDILIYGCNSSTACNFDLDATINDGSCEYCYEDDCDTYPQENYDCDGNCIEDSNCP